MNNHKKYYAARFWCGVKTTTSTPNPRTGRMSIAHSLEAFLSKETRDAWVKNGQITTDMRGNCRRTVTLKEARRLNLGMTILEWNEFLDHLS